MRMRIMARRNDKRIDGVIHQHGINIHRGLHKTRFRTMNYTIDATQCGNGMALRASGFKCRN